MPISRAIGEVLKRHPTGISLALGAGLGAGAGVLSEQESAPTIGTLGGMTLAPVLNAALGNPMGRLGERLSPTPLLSRISRFRPAILAALALGGLGYGLYQSPDLFRRASEQAGATSTDLFGLLKEKLWRLKQMMTLGQTRLKAPPGNIPAQASQVEIPTHKDREAKLKAMSPEQLQQIAEEVEKSPILGKFKTTAR